MTRSDGDSLLVEARAEACVLRLVERMLSGVSLYEACALESIAYSTAKGWFSQEKHQTTLALALGHARAGVLDRARSRMEVGVDTAVDALLEVAQGIEREGGGRPKPRDRVVAAAALLDRVGLHPRRTVEHQNVAEAASDEELLRRLLPQALEVLEVDAIDLGMVQAAAKAIDVTPSPKPAKVPKSQQKQSTKKRAPPKKPAKKRKP